MKNPPWGLYILIVGYLLYNGSAQTASNNFDGASPDFPQNSLSMLTARLSQY